MTLDWWMAGVGPLFLPDCRGHHTRPSGLPAGGFRNQFLLLKELGGVYVFNVDQ